MNEESNSEQGVPTELLVVVVVVLLLLLVDTVIDLGGESLRTLSTSFAPNVSIESLVASSKIRVQKGKKFRSMNATSTLYGKEKNVNPI